MEVIKVLSGLKQRQDKIEAEFGNLRKDMKKLENDQEAVQETSMKTEKNLQKLLDGKMPEVLVKSIVQEIEKVRRV